MHLDRRTLLIDLGRTALGLVVAAPFLSACADGAEPGGDDRSGDGGLSTDGLAGGWGRVDRGFVSAWVLVRDGVAIVVDTGDEGSADAVAATLVRLGAGWDDVSDVVLTHLHGDHVGSLAEVAAAASGAALWVGEADAPGINSPRPLGTLLDGDRVGPLQVLATPGHTPGSVSLYDAEARVLVAGDALTSDDSGVQPPNARFTPDMESAVASVGRLADLDVATLLVGHGPPVVDDAGLGAAMRATVG